MKRKRQIESESQFQSPFQLETVWTNKWTRRTLTGIGGMKKRNQDALRLFSTTTPIGAVYSVGYGLTYQLGFDGNNLAIIKGQSD